MSVASLFTRTSVALACISVLVVVAWAFGVIAPALRFGLFLTVATVTATIAVAHLGFWKSTRRSERQLALGALIAGYLLLLITLGWAYILDQTTFPIRTPGWLG